MTRDSKETSREDKAKLLREAGWYDWYNPDYWCHEQFGGIGKDPTYRGMSLEAAYEYETKPERRGEINRAIDAGASMMRAFSNLGQRNG